MTARKKCSLEEIHRLFIGEFGHLDDRFAIYRLSVPGLRESNADHIWKPGVYIYWHPEIGAVKVGRHLANSRKRALEHVVDNTAGRMAELGEDPDTMIIFYNVKDVRDKHWVAAIEIFLEERICPLIRSGRLG